MKKKVAAKATGRNVRSKAPTFEEALHRLEAIVSKLEQGDAPLDATLALYEEGVGLARVCQHQLREAERKVELLEDKDGTLQRRPFPGHETSKTGGDEETDETDEASDAMNDDGEEADADEETTDDEEDDEEVGGQDTLF